MSRIALSMIVKGTGDEPQKLRRALSSVASHVDARFITLTGPKEELKEAEKVCEEFNCRVSYVDATIPITEDIVESVRTLLGWEPKLKEGDKVFCFDLARNYNLEQIPKEFDWIVWMDCDDVFRNAEKLHAIADSGLQNGIEAFYFNYLYEVELEGDQIKNVIIQHLRERLVRNIGVYKWIAPIHETLIEQRPTRKIDNPDCDVVHLSTKDARMESLHRNLRVLEYSIYQTQGKDPRPLYYLAKLYYDLNNDEDDEKSKKLILKYLEGENKSGWPEERAQAWEYLSDIYRRHKEYNNSIKSCMNALIESPKSPMTYIGIALTYMQKQDWENALFWIKLSTSVPAPKTTLVINPKDIQARTLEVLYNACLNLSMIDEAWAAGQKLITLYPDDQNILNALRFVELLRQERDLTKSVVQIANHLTLTGESPKVKALLSSLPKSIENNPFMINLYQQNNPPKAWEDNEITIYCGQGFTPWSPKKLTDPGKCFVGGSEEAVILMAEALVKQGWKVTVYNDCGDDEGEINGVQWLPYYKFNRLDNFNILIAWRDIRFFDTEFKAKNKYLWCHDIQSGMEYTPERIARIDKVFFLSKWHYEHNLELQKNLPQEKVFYTTNGITV